MSALASKLKKLQNHIKTNQVSEFDLTWRACRPKTQENFFNPLIDHAYSLENSVIFCQLMALKPALIETLVMTTAQSQRFPDCDKNRRLLEYFFKQADSYFIWVKFAGKLFDRVIASLNQNSNDLAAQQLLPSLLKIFSNKRFRDQIIQLAEYPKTCVRQPLQTFADQQGLILELTQQPTGVKFQLIPQVSVKPEQNIAPEPCSMPSTLPDLCDEPTAVDVSVLSVDALLAFLNQENFAEIERIIATATQHEFRGLNKQEALGRLARFILDEALRYTWTIKNNNKVEQILIDRDQQLATKSVVRELKGRYAVKMFRAIDPELFSQLCRGSSTSLQLTRSALETWYKKTVEGSGCYSDYDVSDDSDSNDGVLLGDHLQPAESPRVKRLRRFQQIQQQPGFWCRTRRSDTGGKSALLIETEKIQEQPMIDSEAIRRRLIRGSLKGSGRLQERAALPVANLKSTKPKFLAAYRGINYLPDRWRTPSRREHYQADQTGRTQYAEAVLMAEADVYRHFTAEQLTDESLQRRYAAKAAQLKTALSACETTGPCVASTVKPRVAPYVFNSFADYLQHCYSNGISQHLLALAELLKQREGWLRDKFSNAYNYALSTGERPSHSLRYALGLKSYYQHAFDPCYNKDGSLGHFHAGKLGIFLFPKEDYLKFPQMNRVTQLILDGRVPIENNIAAEVEATFIAEIPGQYYVAELPLRFPTFHKPYKLIYEIKYGLNEALYNLFKKFIVKTTPFSEERKAVVELLKEWLCAYYEVMAIEIAQVHAQEKDGTLVYLDAQNQESHVPPIRPFTHRHLETQNQTHVLQNVRWHIGEKMAVDHNVKPDEIYFPPEMDLPASVKAMQADEEAMREVIANRGDGETVKLTNSQEALRLERGMVEEEAKLEVAKAVLASKHYTFTSKTPGTSQPRPPADSRIRLGKRTASDVQAYDGVIPSSPSC